MTPAAAIAEFRARLEARHLAAALATLRDFLGGKFSLADLEPLNRVIGLHRDWLATQLTAPPVRLAVLGGYTTQPIRLLLPSVLLAEGLLGEVYESAFNTWRLEVLNRESGLYAFRPTLVLLAINADNLDSFPAVGAGEAEVAALLDSTVSGLQSLWAQIAQHTGAAVIQHTFAPPALEPAGRLGARAAWSRTRFLAALNERLWALDGRGVRLLDVGSAATRTGLESWSDPRWFFHSKHGFNPAAIPAYGLLLAGQLRAHFGRSRKCLVLDLDDTLWGGTIGDDGLDGIRLGPGTAEGEAHAAFCAYVKQLGARGVLLAVNSRNDPAIARAVFEQHPAMPLKPADFAAFVCNWEPKSANLRAIAQQLNLGLDSLVFMDNDPAICAEVRAGEPAVYVVQAEGDPAYFPRRLDQLRLFESLDLTAEDVVRQQSYAAQTQVAQLAATHATHEDFLRDLAMRAELRAATAGDLPRLEQLFKKTNQFNLTGEVFTSAALAAQLADPDAVCLGATLTDRFAAHGLVAAVTGRFAGDELLIENWVMSCRVFSRTFEDYLLNQLAALAAARGAKTVRGPFRASAKNDYARQWLERGGLLVSPATWQRPADGAARTTFVGTLA